MVSASKWLDLGVPINQGDVLSHSEMCHAEGRNLQQGMNYRPHGRRSILLMSRRPGAPYADRVEDDGRTLIYEGHDEPRSATITDPKTVDQPEYQPSGQLTQNGLFARAAMHHRDRGERPDLVHVYEKIKPNIWTFNGVFRLVDAWQEPSGGRQVFKFKLELVDDPEGQLHEARQDLEHNRVIPPDIKLEVWKRDDGRCVTCGATDNLHFDHIVPFSKGGSSLVAANVQLLCARHNLAKSDRIE